MIKTRQQTGFSLIELMIGLVLGLFVTGIAIAVFTQSKRNYNQDEEIARLQENGRYAIQLLSRDLAMAGFLGNMQIADDVTVSITTDDCGIDWSNESPLLKPIKIFDADATTLSCLSDALDGTEIIVIKRMRGQPTTSTNNDQIIMRSNGKDGTLFITSTTTPAGYQDWEFLARAYYVADENNDGVPGLHRARLISDGGTLKVVSDGDIVPGVQDIRVTYGLDTIGNDGIADEYKASPSELELSTAVSGRIDVLVRSTNPNFSYTNNKSYFIGSQTISGRDLLAKDDENGVNYYGRVFTTTVQMRNVAYHIQIKNLSETDL